MSSAMILHINTAEHWASYTSETVLWFYDLWHSKNEFGDPNIDIKKRVEVAIMYEFTENS